MIFNYSTNTSVNNSKNTKFIVFKICSIRIIIITLLKISASICTSSRLSTIIKKTWGHLLDAPFYFILFCYVH